MWYVLVAVVIAAVAVCYDREVVRAMANSRALSYVLIPAYSAVYGVRASAGDYEEGYRSTLQKFFNRGFRDLDRHRPLAASVFISSPSDGSVTRCSASADIQVKGAPLVNVSRCEAARNINIADNQQTVVIYLAPSDYHRTYWPCSGTIGAITAAEGRGRLLMGAVDPGAYRENYRLYYSINTAHGAVVCVLVGSVYINSVDALGHQVGDSVARGAPMANFELGGSTIVLFIPPGAPVRDMPATVRARVTAIADPPLRV